MIKFAKRTELSNEKMNMNERIGMVEGNRNVNTVFF